MQVLICNPTSPTPCQRSPSVNGMANQKKKLGEFLRGPFVHINAHL